MVLVEHSSVEIGEPVTEGAVLVPYGTLMSAGKKVNLGGVVSTILMIWYWIIEFKHESWAFHPL